MKNVILVIIIPSKSTNYGDEYQSKAIYWFKLRGGESGGGKQECGLSIFQEKRIKSK